ncbi:hypothetical protein KGM_212750 [Danaus plexippus plexippus]|uniref:Uncharacterized protein n=1 Tax=Danaus plexippus plexippus TaxID=278856 RepID=A0A212F258_DANPL|nr:hypothetical protein KGM_212750 [Danaus plexippus plexippus]
MNVLDVAVIAGFAIDLQTDPSRSLRTSTPTSCLVWVSNFTIVIMVASAGVYQAWELRFILKNINEDLKKKTSNALPTKGKSFTRYLHRSNPIGITALNNYVTALNRPKCQSLLLKPESKPSYGASFTDESRDDELEVISGGGIRDSSVAYGLACDVLRQINDNYGIVLLFIVLSFFLQLIITPYYMLTTLSHAKSTVLHSNGDVHHVEAAHGNGSY